MVYIRKNFCKALAIFCLPAASNFADNVAIIGGQALDGAPLYTALVSSSGSVTQLGLSGGTVPGEMQSVSMNALGTSLIGGLTNAGSAYAALVFPSGLITPIDMGPLLLQHGAIYSVDINNSGRGIIGGRDRTGPMYAALVPPSGNPSTPLVFPDIIKDGGLITSVAINEGGTALIGGQSYNAAQPAYVGLLTPSGSLTTLSLGTNMDISGAIYSVALNEEGKGIIGGQCGTASHAAYLAFISPIGDIIPLALGTPMDSYAVIRSVAINSEGYGIIGGQSLTTTQPAFAGLVSPAGSITPLNLGANMGTSGVINSVAINDLGQGIIGGWDLTNPSYAALVSPLGSITQLNLGSGMNAAGIIFSVAIDGEGNGLIGGQNYSNAAAYAAFVAPSGSVSALALTGSISQNGYIQSVAWRKTAVTPQIPTSSLSGNNLTFANYINEFAPKKASYFISSELDGTLSKALESVAPTRNGVGMYTASRNLFYVTTSFSRHMRQTQASINPNEGIHLSKNGLSYDSLWASVDLQKVEKTPPQTRPFAVWVEMLGALAYQKPQQQTPGFEPATVGGVLGCDRAMTSKLWVGGGLSYLFTHIQEEQDFGHSHIQQEQAFIYSSWDNQRYYCDLMLMGGVFQIDQIRKSTLPGFSFRSSSQPSGWQALPHGEVGYKKAFLKQSKVGVFQFNPFVMVDWMNSWQKSYEEKGNSPFNAGQKSYYGSLLYTEAGLRFCETFFLYSGNLILQEKLSYANAQSYHAGKVKGFLVGSPGSFVVETLAADQNLAIAELALGYDPLKRSYPKTVLFYQGQFGSTYQSHQLNLELDWQF